MTLKQDAVICGVAWFEECFRQLDPQVRFEWTCRDGDRATAGTRLCSITGQVQALLTAERTALNFLQTLSGTATAAAELVGLVAGTGARILDTRKTVPGLRLAQKFAVRCGGAENHRVGLFDAVLIKENHLKAIGSIEKAVAEARTVAGDRLIEVEVESFAEAEQALATSADRLLLDEFTLDALRRTVELRNSLDLPIMLEASGNIDHSNVRSVAETGVDYISAGDITKNIRAVDLSLRVV